jgi:hypothetical protein
LVRLHPESVVWTVARQREVLLTEQANRARQALTRAAMALLRSDLALGAFY